MYEKINKLFKFSVKCDDQKHYKAIIEAAMIYTPKVFTDNGPMQPRQFVTVKILAQENQSVSFQKHRMSNLGLLPTGYVLLNQNKRELELSV